MKIIKFYADWCNPCKAQAKILEQIVEEEPVKLIEVDVDSTSDTDIDLVNSYNVRGLPTIIIVDDNFETLAEFRSLTTYDKLKETINKLKQ